MLYRCCYIFLLFRCETRHIDSCWFFVYCWVYCNRVVPDKIYPFKIAVFVFFFFLNFVLVLHYTFIWCYVQFLYGHFIFSFWIFVSFGFIYNYLQFIFFEFLFLLCTSIYKYFFFEFYYLHFSLSMYNSFRFFWLVFSSIYNFFYLHVLLYILCLCTIFLFTTLSGCWGY